MNLELGVIGNCEIAALIDGAARIVWGCLPRLDGDPAFCALLTRDGATTQRFSRMLAGRTRLGLLSEDIDPATGELWGNFPQTYSMVDIVSCAVRLSRSWEELI
jgi:GH15 family glucan-1,4-alpha-glucosidase